jgi:hypothetical protein
MSDVPTCMVNGLLMLSPCSNMTERTLATDQWRREVSYSFVDAATGFANAVNDNDPPVGLRLPEALESPVKPSS